MPTGRATATSTPASSATARPATCSRTSASRAPPTAAAGTRAPLHITVANSGSGHDFPSGFPEGRVAWVAVRAWDLASGRELDLYDAHWRRTSQGVGYLTRDDMPDPNFPRCR